MEASVAPLSQEEDAHIAEQPIHETQTPLDYVVQNLQCRTGNPRNRCYANAPACEQHSPQR